VVVGTRIAGGTVDERGAIAPQWARLVTKAFNSESKMMKAKDVMTEGPTAIRVSASIREAMALFQTLEVRHLPVIDRDGNLVGILSDRDMRALMLPSLFEDPKMLSRGGRLETAVSYIMSAAVFTARPDTNIAEIVQTMIDQKIGAVPVVDGDGILVGIITYVDLLRELLPFAPAA
jgi:acetoin utilization protein AcuB